MRRRFGVLVLATVVLGAVPQAASARVFPHGHATQGFCAIAAAHFYPRHVELGGKKVYGNAAAFNCAPNHRERIGMTWRISGPCHPRFRGARVFALHHNVQVVYIFRFRPRCIGQYRLAVKNFHGNKLISYASFYLRVHG
jgi:hypothetical protein